MIGTTRVNGATKSKEYMLEKTDLKLDNVESIRKLTKSGLYVRVYGQYIETSPDLKTWTKRIGITNFQRFIPTEEYDVIVSSYDIAVTIDGINFKINKPSWSPVFTLDVIGNALHFITHNKEIIKINLDTFATVFLDKFAPTIRYHQDRVKKGDFFYYYGSETDNNYTSHEYQYKTRDFMNFTKTELDGYFDISNFVDKYNPQKKTSRIFTSRVNLAGYEGFAIFCGGDNQNTEIVCVDENLKVVGYVKDFEQKWLKRSAGAGDMILGKALVPGMSMLGLQIIKIEELTKGNSQSSVLKCGTLVPGGDGFISSVDGIIDVSVMQADSNNLKIVEK
ncbi:MAG: hypothetical protein RSN61_21410 [Chryseobacterium sp.]|uniref:hypothetical protein n=1 Tax=Chryseobacterium sp. TaxID=1871047 RepID=UPI002FC77995